MAQRPVVRRRRADDDIEAAVSFYLDEGGVEVAQSFLNDLEASLGIISKRPTAGSQRYAHELRISDLRQWPMRRFPFLIFYVERRHQIEIARVLHGKRDIPTLVTLDDTE